MGADTTTYKGSNKMLTGIVFGVLTFWLFAQSLVNIVPAVQGDLGVNMGTLNIAISLTALFSGLFTVAFGGLADRLGRKLLTYIGLGLTIAGSLLLVIAQGPTLLIIGRILQGLSAAAIMPATIALVNEYFKGKDRQRALSFWSIGSWGGSGITSFLGGMIATTMGWRWIFVISIVFALAAMWMIKDTPESKGVSNGKFKFDFVGLGIFIVVMLGMNVFITQGGNFGWSSPLTLGIAAITVVGLIIFIKYETGRNNALMDFNIFKSKAYTAATVSNFLLNAVAGTLVVANTYVQMGRGFSSLQSGMLSIGYLVAVLSFIRVGEKIMQKRDDARFPMILGASLNMIGILMMSLTFLPNMMYTVTVFFGFILFGIGLGIYATPSTDTAVTQAPQDKIGEAAGIYKMSSSLGNSFGLAIATAVYGGFMNFTSVESAASAGIITNVIFSALALVSVMILIPHVSSKSGQKSRKSKMRSAS